MTRSARPGGEGDDALEVRDVARRGVQALDDDEAALREGDARAPGLRVLRAHRSFAGLVLTEVNPTHDPDGAELSRLADALVTVLAA